MKLLFQSYPELEAEWDYERNVELDPNSINMSYKEKIWWICKDGHHYQCSLSNKVYKHSGCPYCSGRLVISGINDLETLNPQLAQEWHPKKNGALKPSHIKAKSAKKVWWLGKCGHEWMAAPYSRMNGAGCLRCADIKRGKNNAKVIDISQSLSYQYPSLTKEWNYGKNEGLSPDTIKANSHKKVWWKCVHGHEWQATPHNRANGTDCPICSNRIVVEGVNDLETTNPELVEEWHSELNKEMTPQNISGGCEKKAWWKCKYGHEWNAVISSRVRGAGCPICNGESNTSFAEQAIFFYMSEAFENVKSRYKRNKVEIDVFLEDENIGIEYDGYRYHQDTKKDIKKNSKLSLNGIRLIRIRENGCPPLPSEIEIISMKNNNEKELEKVIYQLLEKLKANNVDVNISRDRQNILNCYISLKVEKSLEELFPELAKEWCYGKNVNLKPSMFTTGSNKKVWWKGKCGHEWQASISSRVHGNGCAVCHGKSVMKGVNDLQTLYPLIALEWDEEKNGQKKPDMYTKGSNVKVWWKCINGHVWERSINDNVRRNGRCPVCKKEI